MTPLDTTGAGDTFNASLLSNVLAEVPLVASAQRAVNAASALIEMPATERATLLLKIQQSW